MIVAEGQEVAEGAEVAEGVESAGAVDCVEAANENIMLVIWAHSDFYFFVLKTMLNTQRLRLPLRAYKYYLKIFPLGSLTLF